MFKRWGTGDRGPGTGVLLLAALVASGSGCRTVVDTVAGVFGPGQAGDAVDAHVVYRLRAGCPTLLARSTRHGYTVLAPAAPPEGIENREAFVGTGFEETGVFEGPVRTGDVVFRYVAPAASDRWDAGPVDVAAQVDAVELTLQQGRARLDALCGPLVEGPEPDPTVPRLPEPVTRPPRYNAGDPGAYVCHMVALVGDRDPVALLAAGPDRLAEAVAGLGEADARRTPEPGAWSVLQVLRHVADSEVVYGYRLRLIVAADRPAIPGYDQDAWADSLHYHRGTVADALADHADARRVTVRWLRALDDGQWERVGVHSERGEESVRQIATLLAAHDLAHADQVERARAALGV